MEILQIVFSPTGGTQKVAGLAARLKEICSVRKGNELFI